MLKFNRHMIKAWRRAEEESDYQDFIFLNGEKVYGYWVIGYPYSVENAMGEVRSILPNIAEEGDEYEVDVIPETVCRFIGNKFGYDLWENDLIRILPEDKEGIIHWNPAECEYSVLFDTEEDWEFLPYILTINKFEKVGNLFSNVQDWEAIYDSL